MSLGPELVIYAAFAIGLVFGAVGLLSSFCLLSSLRGLWGNGDGRLVRTYALAIAVAIVATQLLVLGHYVDLDKSIYLQPTFSAPLMFAGGLLFGYGMVLSNGCASRALVLLGRGNLRSFVVIVTLGIAAQMTLKGLIAPARLAILQWTQGAPQVISLPALLQTVGLDATAARILALVAVSGALAMFAFSHAGFRKSGGQVAAGLIIGLLVAAGWFATGFIGADDFNPTPLTSFTFVAPIADSVQYVMLSTGSTLNFGIALVGGVLAGSFITSLLTNRFKWDGYTSPSHMIRSIGGAALMGSGGAMALGCSVGQGLTGVSTLALASFLAITGILVGAAAGLRGPLQVRALASA